MAGIKLDRYKSSDPVLEEALNTHAELLEKLANRNFWAGRNMLFNVDLDNVILEADGEDVGGGTDKNWLPWDLYSSVGVGEPNEDGKYSSLKCKFWPGSIGGIIPTEMFTEFTVPTSGMQYLVVHVTTGTGAVQSCTMSIESSHPEGMTETLGAPQGTFDWIVGAFVDGVYFNIAKKNLVVTARETKREDNPDASPYALPYQSYFIWSVS